MFGTGLSLGAIAMNLSFMRHMENKCSVPEWLTDPNTRTFPEGEEWLVSFNEGRVGVGEEDRVSQAEGRTYVKSLK